MLVFIIKFIRRLLFCRHYYERFETVRSVKNGYDNLVIDESTYTCKKCGKEFMVQDKVKVEKDYYKNKGGNN